MGSWSDCTRAAGASLPSEGLYKLCERATRGLSVSLAAFAKRGAALVGRLWLHTRCAIWRTSAVGPCTVSLGALSAAKPTEYNDAIEKLLAASKLSDDEVLRRLLLLAGVSRELIFQGSDWRPCSS